jgi:hypothetical protein
MKVKLSWRLVAALLLGLVGYYIVFQAFYNQIAFKTIFPYDGLADMMVGVFYNFTPTFLQSIFIAAVIFRPTKVHHIGRKIAVDAILVITMLVLYNLCYLHFFHGRVDWGGSAFNAIFVFLGIETTFYVLNFKNSMREAQAQKQLALQYRYDALKAQVNPHFLFNSLNILYSLIDIDQQKSREFVLSLSQMYRYIMSQQNRDTVPLRDEMDFLHNYVDILMKRYRDQLTVDINGEDSIVEQQLVPYTLQLLIENVTKHNIISTRHPMTVTINIGNDNVTVSNPIQPKTSESPSHVGLRYLTELYQAHGKEFAVSNDGTTFTAIVPFI